MLRAAGREERALQAAPEVAHPAPSYGDHLHRYARARRGDYDNITLNDSRHVALKLADARSANRIVRDSLWRYVRGRGKTILVMSMMMKIFSLSLSLSLSFFFFFPLSFQQRMLDAQVRHTPFASGFGCRHDASVCSCKRRIKKTKKKEENDEEREIQ